MLESLISSYYAKKGLDIYSNLFSKIFAIDLKYEEKKSLLQKVASTLNDYYNKDVLGGNIEDFITSAEFIKNFNKFYTPFEVFNLKQIDSNLDFNTLPEDFEDKLIETVISKLLESENFEFRLQQKYLTENINEILEFIQILKSQIIPNNKIIPSSVPKKNYPFNKTYIKRFITDRIYNDSDWISYYDSALSPQNLVNHTIINEPENYENTLIEQIQKGEQKRIVLLSTAGYGKSTELEFIAHYFSKPASTFFPIKISLNNILSENIEDFISIENNAWLEIQEEQRLIILDGLDEINSNHIYEVFSKIEKFGIKYPKTQIIVSCRNNFYTAGTNEEDGSIKGFKSYYLQDISLYYLIKYVKEELINDYETFFEEITSKKKGDLLKNPFYLIHLVEYYKSKNTLPNTSSDIIHLILELKIENDKKHFERKINSFEFKQSAIFKLAEKIAVYNQSLGKNYIDENELLRLEKDTDLLYILKHSFIIKKDPEYPKRRQFEHNNFQEYLAAKFLSKLELKEIKAFIAFEPDFKKIKPYWLNTFTHLFNLLEQDKTKFKLLLDWSVKIEPKALIQLEVEEIEIGVRETIFMNILDNSFESCVSIYAEDFNYNELFKFSGKSDNIINYLLSSLEKVTYKNNIIDIVELISNIENTLNYEDEIIFSFKVILEKYDHYNLVYHTLNSIAKLKITDKCFLNYLVEKYKNSPSIHKRNGLLSIFLNSDHTEEWTLNFIEKTSIIKDNSSLSDNKSFESTNDVEPDFLDNNELLHSCYRKITSKEGLSQLLQYFIDNRTAFQFKKDDITSETIIENLVLIGQDEDIFKIVLDWFKLIANEYEDSNTLIIIKYFAETQNIFKAFKMLLDDTSENRNSLWLACYLADKYCLDYVINQYQSNLLSNDIIYVIRNGLGWHNKKFHDYFYTEINRISNNNFKYPPQRNYELERYERNKEDIKLLFNKDLFEQKVNLIFEKYGTQLTKDTLWEIRNEKLNSDELEDNIVINTLREIADTIHVTKAIIESFLLNENNWIWFKLSKLEDYAKDKKYLLPEHIKWIEDWCNENVLSADFINSVKTDEKGTITYQFKEWYLFKFFMLLKLEYPKEKLLDLLEYGLFNDFVNGKIESHLFEKLSTKDIKNRVLNFLKKENKNLSLLSGHIKLIEKHNIKEALPLLIDILKNNMVNEWVKQNTLSVYLKIGGHKNKLVELIDYINYKEKWNWDLLEVLAEIKSKKALTALKSKENLFEENWKFIAKAFLQFKEIDGLEIIYNRLILKETFDHDYSLPSDEIKKIPFDKTQEYLFLILNYVYSEEYRFTRVRRLDEDIFRCLEYYIGTNEELYFLIIDKVKRKILPSIVNNDKKADLNYRLQRVEKSFYTNKKDFIDEDELIRKINAI